MGRGGRRMPRAWKWGIIPMEALCFKPSVQVVQDVSRPAVKAVIIC